MKTIGIILTLCVLQAWALPRMEESAPLEGGNIAEFLQAWAEPKVGGKFDKESVVQFLKARKTTEEKTPRESDTVARFRAAIDYHFGHYDAFYDAVTKEMTEYRIEHVHRMRENLGIYMAEFGYIIEAVRARGGNQNTANMAINACARRGNATLVDAVTTYFYPTFRLVQDQTSVIPLMTLDALRRGNVFMEEEDEVLVYLEIQYEAFMLQWLQTVSKFFRWEKDKADVNGDFYKEEMNLCLCAAVPEGLRCGQSPIPTAL